MATLDNPIIALLPTARDPQPWLTTPEVAKRLGSQGHVINHVKTVQRRLEKLEAQGLVIGQGMGRALVWQRKEGASGLAKGAMNVDEALALQILRKFSARQLPEPVSGWLKALFDTAEARLKAFNSDDGRRYAKWSDKVAVVSGHFQLMPPKIKEDVFRTLTNALFMERLLHVQYQRASRETPAKRTLMPLGLVEAGDGILTLIARSQSSAKDFYPEINRYRLDRMANAKLADEDFRYPNDFNLESFIKEDKGMEFYTGEKTKVTLKMNESSAKFLEELPLAPDQTVTHHKNGSVTLSATVVLSYRFHEWLLARSADLEVISPKALRKAVKEALASALKQYE